MKDEMDYTLSPIKESIFIIHWIADHLNRSIKVINKEELYKKDEFISHQMMRLSFIQNCIIIQEWQRLEKLSKNDKKLMNTMRIASPLIKEIRRWTGIINFRNSVLAHFGRDKNGKFIPYWRSLHSLKYPTTTWDFTFINTLTLTISGLLEKRHPLELRQAKKILGKDRQRFEKYLYNHELSIQNDDDYKIRKDIIWKIFTENAESVFKQEMELKR